jgi:hypothetical protein
MQKAIILSIIEAMVVVLNVISLNVVMLNVVAPIEAMNSSATQEILCSML